MLDEELKNEIKEHIEGLLFVRSFRNENRSDDKDVEMIVELYRSTKVDDSKEIREFARGVFNESK